MEANQSYSPFALYATFYHGGDFSAAAESLAQEGYGEQDKPIDPVIEATIQRILNKHEQSFKKLEIMTADKTIEFEEKKRAVEKMTVLDYIRSVNIATPEKLAERKKMAREMVFVLPGIAARGQATVIYAPPNSGKTLVTMAIIKQQALSGALGDLNIVYLNFDDDFNSCNLKGDFLFGTGINLIDITDHTPEDGLKMMEASIKDGSAGSMCFILDTLIRFVSDSDKNTQRDFTSLIQRFVASQGTVIALGHTNKHKDAEGKNVHGGTSDIRNSFSQSAMIEILVDPPEDQAGERQIKIKNDKLRGMAKCSNIYSYAHGDSKTWIERAETVRNVGEQESKEAVNSFIANTQRKQDEEIIQWIVGFLKTGPKPARDIIKASGTDVPGSQSERTRVLNTYCGQDWEQSRGNNGGWNYYLDEPAPIQQNKIKSVPWG